MALDNEVVKESELNRLDGLRNDKTADKKEGRRMELLAPAGNFEAFKAAVENGADAVYLGGKSFGARASAENFDSRQLKEAVTYAHERLVKVYVTVNTLVADQEFPKLLDYIYELYTIGADALILQDIGVAHLLKEVLPEMEIHASTQMTQNNTFGLKQLERLGFSRVILARETTAEEIGQIVKNTNLDVEVFVHGALCICYSGQCLMSSYIGARSGNRGRCAQPCRLTYSLMDEKGKDLLAGKKLGDHLLSPRDLNLIDELAELKKLGVKSLKIEGRMKRPEYVATVTRIYRKALDSLELGIQRDLDPKDRYELTQIFNRGFTPGYFKGYQGADMMSFSRPNNRGTLLGRIVGINKNWLSLKLENYLNVGDGVEVWTNRGREGVVVNKIYNSAGESVTKATAGETVSIEFKGQARIGDRVFKTHDEELMEKARLSYQEGKETRKRPLKMRLTGRVGTKLELQVQDARHRVTVESQSEAVEAWKRPLEYDYLYKQLGRLGNTPYYLAELDLALEGNLMLPVKEINEMRRTAVAKLLQHYVEPKNLDHREYTARVNNWYTRLANEQKRAQVAESAEARLSVAIADLQLLKPVIQAGANRVLLGGEHWRFRPKITLEDLEKALQFCQTNNVELVWRLPRILNERQSRKIYSELQTINSWQERPRIMTANLAGIEMLKRIDPGWSWETDHYFYVFNKAALHWVLEQGASKAALSTELSLEQLQQLAAANTELLVFGDMEIMVSEYCVIGATLTDCSGNPRDKCGAKCQRGNYYLKDRMNYCFPLVTDRECRMHIFNAKRLNLLTELTRIANIGIKNIRLDLLRATPAQAETSVRVFKDIWSLAAAGENISKEKMEQAAAYLERLYPEGFTKGHFFRGVLE